MPWCLFANKDFVLVLGDWNDDDDLWPDTRFDDTDSSEDEHADEVEISGACFDTVPVIHQAHKSNQYGEMLGRAAQYGKPYLSQGDQEQQTADTFNGPNKDSSNISDRLGSESNRLTYSCIFSIPSVNHDRAVLGEIIENSHSGIPSPSSAPKVSTSRNTTITTGDGHQEMKWVRKGHDKTSKKGNNGQTSDPDDDDDPTPEPSDSEDDDAPNIDLVRNDWYKRKKNC